MRLGSSFITTVAALSLAGSAYGAPTKWSGNGHYYEVFAGNIPWTSAKTEAESVFYQCVRGHLVTITDESENIWVSTSLPGTGPNLWLGASQNHNSPTYSEPAGGWEWVTSEPFGYTNWGFNEPNNDQGGSDYLEFKNELGSIGPWNDEPDSATPNTGYIVEFDIPNAFLHNATGQYYEVVPGNITWSAAKAAAENRIFNCVRGHLATITSAPENDWVLVSGLPGTGPNLWLGAKQNHASPTYSEPDGGWEWVTREPFSYANWGFNEPNNDQGGSDYLESMDAFPAGMWNDEPDSVAPNMGYIVEYNFPRIAYGGGSPQPRKPRAHLPPYDPDSGQEQSLATGGSSLTLVLGQNRPNPFSRETSIRFSVPFGDPVKIEVFTLSGRRVNVLFEGRLDPGLRELLWDGRDSSGARLPAGIYFYRLVTEQSVLTKKLILLP